MNLDERISEIAVAFKTDLEADALRHKQIKQLIRDAIEYVKPERAIDDGRWPTPVIEGMNCTIDEMEAKAKELRL